MPQRKPGRSPADVAAFRHAPSLVQWRQRRRARYAAIVLVAALLLPPLFWLDHRGRLLHGGDDWSRYHNRTFAVEHVFDGDTLAVLAPDGSHRSTRVRLWGIDTPELGRDGEADEPWAAAAAARAAELTAGRHVTLLLQSHQTRDRYQRLVAYVILDDGASLGERLLIEGLATTVSRYPHTQMDRYEKLEHQARVEQRGIWSEAKRPSAAPKPQNAANE